MPYEIEGYRPKPGGQQAGTPHMGFRIVDTETDIEIKVPPSAAHRSQHKTREAIVTCLELLKEELSK